MSNKKRSVCLPEGEYSTPVGTLTICRAEGGDEICLKIRGRDAPDVTWRFRNDGVFQNFEVQSQGPSVTLAQQVDGSEMVVTCEHITPNYTGHLFTVSGPRVAKAFLCGKCVCEKGMALENRKLNFIDGSLFRGVMARCPLISFSEAFLKSDGGDVDEEKQDGAVAG